MAPAHDKALDTTELSNMGRNIKKKEAQGKPIPASMSLADNSGQKSRPASTKKYGIGANGELLKDGKPPIANDEHGDAQLAEEAASLIAASGGTVDRAAIKQFFEEKYALYHTTKGRMGEIIDAAYQTAVRTILVQDKLWEKVEEHGGDIASLKGQIVDVHDKMGQFVGRLEAVEAALRSPRGSAASSHFGGAGAASVASAPGGGFDFTATAAAGFSPQGNADPDTVAVTTAGPGSKKCFYLKFADSETATAFKEKVEELQM